MKDCTPDTKDRPIRAPERHAIERETERVVPNDQRKMLRYYAKGHSIPFISDMLNVPMCVVRHICGEEKPYVPRKKGAKLTAEIVREIRAASAVSTQAELAERFNCNQTNISSILRRKTWRNE
jgi:DNA primase